MTRLAIAFGAALAAFLGASPADARSPIEGRWQKGSMQIEIGPCGASLCGTVVKASATQQDRARRGSGMDLIGATLIENIRLLKPGLYRARVFVADRNLHATCRIRPVTPDLLKVSGCVLAIICRSASWTRVE